MTLSGANALNPLLHKGVAEMLLPKRDQSVIAFQKICDNHIPIIIAVQILYPENGVGLMLRED